MGNVELTTAAERTNITRPTSPDGRVKASLLRWEDVFHDHEVAIVDDHLAGVEEQRLGQFASASQKRSGFGVRPGNGCVMAK